MKRKLFGIVLSLFICCMVTPVYAEESVSGPAAEIVEPLKLNEFGENLIEVSELSEEELAYVETLVPVNSLEQNTEDSYVNLGTFKLTAYCPCNRCNYPYGGKPTALGTDYVEGRTIAVDPRVIPLGSIVEINIPGEGWHQYRAEDTGGRIKGNRIDILVSAHQNCNQQRYNSYADVRLLK